MCLWTVLPLPAASPFTSLCFLCFS
jgi:hypothetical protein